MDTKWKKCREKGKVLIGFTSFAVGISLVLVNLIPALAMYGVLAGQDLRKPADYQETAQFRDIITGRLNDLLGVATGGNGWYWGANSSVYISQGAYEGGLAGALAAVGGWTRSASDTVVVAQNSAASVQEEAAEVAAEESPAVSVDTIQQESTWVESPEFSDDFLRELELKYDGDYEAYLRDYYGYDYGYYGYYDENGNLDREKALAAWLGDMDRDKNLLYAVVAQGELLYTNIEDFSDKTNTPWDGTDFSEALPAQDYNFLLWYNREGDGKVQITKNGRETDVYGDGVYRETSPWRLPGYANFKLGDSAKEAVIFLAAAREPRMYLTGSYEDSGITQYGGDLYYLYESVKMLDWRFVRACQLLIAGAMLLVLSLFFHKGLRLGAGRLAAILYRIPLVLKVVVFLLVAVGSLLPGLDAIGQSAWYVRDGLVMGYDGVYLLNQLSTVGICLAVWFWLVFLAVTDLKANGERQRRELLERRQLREMKYPVQKRLIKRERNRLLEEGGVLLLTVSILLVAYLVWYDYMMDRYDYWAWADGDLLLVRGLGVFVMVTAFAVLSALAIFVGLDLCKLKKNRRLAEDIGALSDRIGAVREGKLTDDLRLPEDSDLREAAENLNEISKGLETALAEQIKSERMKVDLVTNVSHDIKTPLTSIISYVELLRQEEDLPQHVKEYIQILGEKSERLRSIVQDVFEVSKATSGQLPIQVELLDMGKLLRQTLADMNGQIEESGLVMKVSFPEMNIYVEADGQRLYRVFQNLIQNALRYSLGGSRIYLTLTEEEGKAVVRIKNTSSVELSDSKDFTERFVRGDDSRTDGGSGLGLSIARSFTEACGGSLLVETDADLFTVTVAFPEKAQEPSEEKETE